MLDFLTPGIIFLARGALSLIFPCTLIVTLRYILDAHYGVVISIGQIALAALVLVPTAVVAKHWAGILYKRRRAAALSARFAPKLSGGMGNLNRLKELASSMETEMCGALWLLHHDAQCLIHISHQVRYTRDGFESVETHSTHTSCGRIVSSLQSRITSR